VIVISIPTVFDPKLAPPGKAVVHAYTAGCEPYDVWAGMDRASAEYKQLKQQRAEVLWKALEKVIPVRPVDPYPPRPNRQRHPPC